VIAIACASAAMDIPFDNSFIDLSFSNLLVDTIENFNPDKRFKNILENITPYIRTDSIFHEFSYQPKSDIFGIFPIIKNKFPALDFMPVIEEPDLFQNLFDRLKVFFSNLGFRFMDEYYLTDTRDFQYGKVWVHQFHYRDYPKVNVKICR
jgi:hypothetical protein